MSSLNRASKKERNSNSITLAAGSVLVCCAIPCDRGASQAGLALYILLLPNTLLSAFTQSLSFSLCSSFLVGGCALQGIHCSIQGFSLCCSTLFPHIDVLGDEVAA